MNLDMMIYKKMWEIIRQSGTITRPVSFLKKAVALIPALLAFLFLIYQLYLSTNWYKILKIF